MTGKLQRIIQHTAQLLFCAVAVFAWLSLDNAIPSEINVIAGKEEKFDFDVPVTFSTQEGTAEVFDNLSPKQEDEVTIGENTVCKISENEDSRVTMDCKLFGVIPVKSVTVNVISEEELIPSGLPIGIYVQTDGVLVIGTGSIVDADGLKKEPAVSVVKSGDYIYAVNGEQITTKEELMEKVDQYGANPIVLGIRRNEEKIELSVEAVKNGDGAYKLGIWVRDDLAGIGTMTYVAKDLTYAALGHGVNDADTSSLLEMRQGSLYQTTIVDIVKGENGTPGELTGVINYQKEYCIGSVTANSDVGICGKLNQIPLSLEGVSRFPIGLKQEVTPGEAEIVCSCMGQRENYAINISEINFSDTKDKREIVFEVTDERLLSLTGGIVQGMSGAPIIQNGKLIGAVTHVYVNNPAKGYGIFIEEMVK